MSQKLYPPHLAVLAGLIHFGPDGDFDLTGATLAIDPNKVSAVHDARFAVATFTLMKLKEEHYNQIVDGLEHTVVLIDRLDEKRRFHSKIVEVLRLGVQDLARVKRGASERAHSDESKRTPDH